jgi:hypothetical protein
MGAWHVSSPRFVYIQPILILAQENPNITFATPTIISGDKSNIDVIAHELAHSWSGNLVSNASWEVWISKMYRLGIDLLNIFNNSISG